MAVLSGEVLPDIPAPTMGVPTVGEAPTVGWRTCCANGWSATPHRTPGRRTDVTCRRILYTAMKELWQRGDLLACLTSADVSSPVRTVSIAPCTSWPRRQ